MRESDIKYFVGIDPSLSRTGLAILKGWEPPILRSFGEEYEDRIMIERQLKHMVRITRFTGDIPETVIINSEKNVQSLFVCVEVPPVMFGNNSGKMTERHELIGMIKYYFAQERGVYVAECPPTMRRKFLGLKGRSSSRNKKEAVQAIALLWPGVDIQNDDEGDALALATLMRIAIMKRDPLLSKLSTTQLEAVAAFRERNPVAF